MYVIIYIKKFLGKSCSLEGNLAPKLLAGTCPRQKLCISPPKVMAGIIPGTIKSATILVKDYEILSAGTVPAKSWCWNCEYFGQSCDLQKYFWREQVPAESLRYAMGGQREFVPAQHNFCRLVTFGGDKGVAAENLVARPPVCCSAITLMKTVLCPKTAFVCLALSI